MTIRWPDEVLPPQNVNFDLVPRTLAGPASVSGLTQVVASDAGIWKAVFGSVIVRGHDAIITHRAIAALLEGRLNPILVPLCRGYQPVPDGAVAQGLYDAVPHSDDAFFSDGTGYVSTVINVTFASGAAARASSASITIGYADTLLPGQHFSVGDRLYRLRSVTSTGASTANITFRPLLREAVAAGDRLEFDDPVCRMRLASDSEMDLALAMRRFGNPTVTFIEDI